MHHPAWLKGAAGGRCAAAPANTGAQQDATAAPAGQQQPAPQARVQKFDDWYYRCVDGKAADGSATTSCEVAQIATVKQGEQSVNVLTLAIAKTPATSASTQKGGKPVASDLVLTTVVPLNMYLPAGLGIDAGDKPVVQLTYRNCNQAGCWSQQKLDAKMVAAPLQKNGGWGQSRADDEWPEGQHQILVEGIGRGFGRTGEARFN